MGMVILKIFKKSSICDIAGLGNFIHLKWQRIEEKHHWLKKMQISAFFPTITFSLNIFINGATQSRYSYLISMSKLKSFKFSLKWRQERNFNSKRFVFMLQQTKNTKILWWAFPIPDNLYPNAISKRKKLEQPARSHLKDLSQSFKMVTDFVMFFSLLGCKLLKTCLFGFFLCHS